MAFLGNKVTTSGVSLADIYAGAGVKYVEERALGSVIGNASIMSGVIKTVVGLAAHKYAPSGILKNAVSIGFCVDGAEDVITGIMAGNFGGIPFAGGIGGNKGDDW